MSRIEVTRESGAAVIHVEGTFAREDVAELYRQLNELRSSRVIIDFSHTRSFSDAAVPLVIRAIGERSCHLRGLLFHQERMFRYFGLSLGTGDDSQPTELGIEAAGAA